MSRFYSFRRWSATLSIGCKDRLWTLGSVLMSCFLIRDIHETRSYSDRSSKGCMRSSISTFELNSWVDCHCRFSTGQLAVTRFALINIRILSLTLQPSSSLGHVHKPPSIQRRMLLRSIPLLHNIILPACLHTIRMLTATPNITTSSQPCSHMAVGVRNRLQRLIMPRSSSYWEPFKVNRAALCNPSWRLTATMSM